jgi:hypothetical protein
MADVVFYEHHRAVEAKAFQSPVGMVGRWTGRKAVDVAAHAKLVAPKPGQGRGYATGQLAANIRSSAPTVGRKGPEADVVSSTDHSLFVHEGTAPHIIRARPTKKLMFFWRNAGRIIFDSEVHHPGTPSNPFLVKALRNVFGGPGR